jgi:sulfur-oxidizing protein SoxY
VKTIDRRRFLQGTLAGGMAAVAVGTGLLHSSYVLAGEWSKAAFEAKDVENAATAYFGSSAAEDSDKIELKAPNIAENGAQVQIEIKSDMPDTESIAILVEQNTAPLTAVFNMSPNTVPNVATRIKMGKTSNVIALVKAGGKLYQTKKEVKVTVGGCGG